MPSQRRVSNFPGVGRNVVTHLHASQFSYSLPGCTPQAHCRSESLLSSNPLTAIADMDSWFPANGFDVGARISCRSSSPVTLNFQHPSERQMGSNVDDDVGINSGHHQLGDFQTETWWPPINVNAIAGRDQSSPQQVTSDTKPASNASTFTPTYNMESWCHDVSNPVAVADVDPNTPCEHPSAIAVVSVVQATADADPVVATRATKGGSRKGTKGKSISAPTSPSEIRPSKENSRDLGVQKSKWNGKRPVSQRENHIWSERQRRKGMNYLFSTLRSLLPHPTSKTDKSTVVGEIIKYIQSLQVKLEELTKKQQQVLGARTLGAFHSMDTRMATLPKAFVSNGGLTLVDHSSDPSSMTAITALPPPGRESCLQSYLGSNVGLHVCGLNVFITTSSPRGRHGLLQQLLVTIHKHELDVINANISTSNASIFHCLHCQASQDAEFLNNALHSALQSVINNFG